MTIGSYAFDAMEKVYGATDPSVQLATVLTPEGVAVVPEIAPVCLLNDVSELHDIAAPAVGKFFAADPSTTEPWKSILEANTAGNQPIDVPILITQGEKDELVLPASTADFVDQLCAAEERVIFRTFPDVTHGLAGERSIPTLLPWLQDALDGRGSQDECSPG